MPGHSNFIKEMHLVKLNEKHIRQIVSDTVVGRPWPNDTKKDRKTSNRNMVTPVPNDLGGTLTSMM